MDVPKKHRSTVNLISAAYPHGIPEEDYLPLLRLLHEEMTFRAIAAVMYSFGKNADETYLDASAAASAEGATTTEVERVRLKLLMHGYEVWKVGLDTEDE